MTKSFSQIMDENPFNNLVIIDSLNLAFRYKHRGAKEFRADYCRTVNSLANSYKAKQVLILGDGGSSYREALLPSYKETRKLKRVDQSEEDKIAFEDFLEEYKQALEMLKLSYPVVQYPGVEADDLAAYVVKVATSTKVFDHIWLISSDRDWDLLVSDTTSRFSYVTRKEITADNWDEEHLYPLHSHIDIKVLMGDKGDDVPGVEGIGEKRAASLIKAYGGALDIYDMLPLPGSQKFIQNLNNFGDRLLLNFELMDLMTYSEDAIGEHIQDFNNILKEHGIIQ